MSLEAGRLVVFTDRENSLASRVCVRRSNAPTKKMPPRPMGARASMVLLLVKAEKNYQISSFDFRMLAKQRELGLQDFGSG